MATFVIDTVNIDTYEHLLVPYGQLIMDSDTNKLVKTDTPTSSTDLVNKSYVDNQISSLIQSVTTISSNVTSITAGNSLTDFQSLTAPANSLATIGDYLIYSSNINITSADVLQFFIGGNSVDSFTAGGLLSSTIGNVIFKIIYQSGASNSANLSWYATVVCAGQTYTQRGTKSSVDLTSSLAIKTAGDDNSLTGTFISYDAILHKIKGS